MVEDEAKDDVVEFLLNHPVAFVHKCIILSRSVVVGNGIGTNAQSKSNHVNFTCKSDG